MRKLISLAAFAAFALLASSASAQTLYYKDANGSVMTTVGQDNNATAVVTSINGAPWVYMDYGDDTGAFWEFEPLTADHVDVCNGSPWVVYYSNPSCTSVGFMEYDSSNKIRCARIGQNGARRHFRQAGDQVTASSCYWNLGSGCVQTTCPETKFRVIRSNAPLFPDNPGPWFLVLIQ